MSSSKSQGLAAHLITEIVRFNTVPLPPGWRDDRHVHPFHQVDIVMSGSMCHYFDQGKPLHSRAGSAVLVPPLTWHSTSSRRGCGDAACKMYLSPSVVSALGERPFKFQTTPYTVQSIRRAAADWAGRRPYAFERVVAAVTMVLLDALDAAPLPRSPLSRGSEFRRQLMAILINVATAPDRAWEVGGLADQCGLSTDHFTRLFQRELGLTPRDFIHESRMRLAAGLLTGPSPKPIKEVARLAGYTTRQAFTRAFFRAFHMSPAQFQKCRGETRGPSMNRRKVQQI